MNFLFGLIPAIGAILIILWFRYTDAISTKTTSALIVFSIAVTGFFSLNTYGPRNELPVSALPYVPDVQEITTGSELVIHKDRIGQFDSKIETKP